jgi:hypothetical protein
LPLPPRAGIVCSVLAYVFSWPWWVTVGACALAVFLVWMARRRALWVVLAAVACLPILFVAALLFTGDGL